MSAAMRLTWLIGVRRSPVNATSTVRAWSGRSRGAIDTGTVPLAVPLPVWSAERCRVTVPV